MYNISTKLRSVSKAACAALCALVMCVGLSVSLSGCSKPAAQQGDKAASQQAAPSKITVTDIDGKTYTFNKPVDKAIIQYSGSGGPFMTMAALFGKDVYKHIAGMDPGLKSYRADMWKAYTKSIPELDKIPVIGAIGKDFNLEKVLSSNAEVVIVPFDQKKAAADTVQPKLEAAGIKVIYIDFHDQTMKNHIASIDILGKLFGKEDRAKEIIAFYKQHRENVEKKVAEALKTKQRPNMYIEVGNYGPEKYGNTFSNSYMWGGIAHEAGANSIGEGAVPNYGSMDPEFLLKKNPEKIVFTGSYWPKAPASIRMGFEGNAEQTKKLVDAYFSERPGWSALNAWKNKEIYVIHHALSRDLYDCSSYEFFGKVCFPEQFKDVDPNATLKEFYQKFLPFEFSGLWYYTYQK